MKIKATISYDGTSFCGWQKQPGKRSVQKEIENALMVLFDQKIEVNASGRTDAGVHALGQVISFDAPDSVNPTNLYRNLNAHLPEDIRVLKTERADDDFDARFSAKTKTYVYKFYLSRYEHPLKRGREWRINDNINVDLMIKNLPCLVGEHDFSSFVSKKSGKTNFVIKVTSAKINKISDFEYELEISANGFLYNMVRIIMGTLVDIGAGRGGVSKMQEILEAKNRARAGKTAPPYALYLKSVVY